MNNFGTKVSFIWSVADLLRGPSLGKSPASLRAYGYPDCDTIPNAFMESGFQYRRRKSSAR